VDGFDQDQGFLGGFVELVFPVLGNGAGDLARIGLFISERREQDLRNWMKFSDSSRTNF
jgi:hypothetical protein